MTIDAGEVLWEVTVGLDTAKWRIDAKPEVDIWRKRWPRSEARGAQNIDQGPKGRGPRRMRLGFFLGGGD